MQVSCIIFIRIRKRKARERRRHSMKKLHGSAGGILRCDKREIKKKMFYKKEYFIRRTWK